MMILSLVNFLVFVCVIMWIINIYWFVLSIIQKEDKELSLVCIQSGALMFLLLVLGIIKDKD